MELWSWLYVLCMLVDVCYPDIGYTRIIFFPIQ